jgi:hypothetical protein
MNPETHSYLAMYQTTQAYLKLPAAYCAYLGGPRWSNDDDALVYPDGRCFVFCEPIAAFLEGLGTGGRVSPFGCVLHWIDLLLPTGRKHLDPAVRRLRKTFHETGSGWRNAGALAAAMSEGIPEPAAPPRLEHVCRRLRDKAFPIRWFMARFHESALNPAEVPAITPEDFERRMIERLAGYSDGDLQSWLQHGRGPLRSAGETLVREPPRPRTLTGVLAALLLRPRLAGAETHVTRLIGALTLPPRRLAPQELPVGGYADMTTRGEVEHLLPTQHALDELDFLRRFAERELLFFRREEPPAQNQQKLVVLIDQGVRTWGDVRLVLAAAALALGKQAVRRAQQFRLAATSNAGRLLDPVEADDAALGELIEASDLSFHPGAALEAVLEQPSAALRDVVLLTHPRNLREADVLTAARRAGPRDRLFAVALDETGAASVSEIRHGAPVALRQFRVEYEPAKPAPVLASRDEPLAALPPWSGAVEPVPFPFRFGTSDRIAHFEFDHGGQWLLTVSGNGLLHLWDTNSKGWEMLPRPMTPHGKVLDNIQSVIGVVGGFVVTALDGVTLRIAHYDVCRRKCCAYGFLSGEALVRTHYAPEVHTLRLIYSNPGRVRQFLQLATGAVASVQDLTHHPDIQRAFEALDRNPVVRREVIDSGGSDPPVCVSPGSAMQCNYCVHAESGRIVIRKDGDERSFLPHADGKPLLCGAQIAAAHAAGDVLVLRAQLKDKSVRLLVFGMSAGAVICVRRFDARIDERRRFRLSPDGRWLAREWGHRVIIENIADPRVQMTTRCGGYSPNSELYLGEACFMLGAGQHWHLVNWSETTLRCHHEKRHGTESIFQDAAWEVMLLAPMTVVRTASAAPPPTYDPRRFVAAATHGRLEFTLDCYGQVAVFDLNGTLLCMFMAFRDRLAAWLPDGSRYGPAALGLGPETPDARARLAQTLSDGEPAGTNGA